MGINFTFVGTSTFIGTLQTRTVTRRSGSFIMETKIKGRCAVTLFYFAPTL